MLPIMRESKSGGFRGFCLRRNIGANVTNYPSQGKKTHLNNKNPGPRRWRWTRQHNKTGWRLTRIAEVVEHWTRTPWEETAAEEAAVAAGEAAGTGDVGVTVDVAAAAVEEDDERG